ncbi:MAG: acyltransferase [Chloroflexota bacterium]
MNVLKARGLVIGEDVAILEDVFLDGSHCWHISIGDHVTLAPRVMILAHDASTKRHLDLTKVGKVEIGDRVFVGAGTIIMPGVRIGHDAIIGAGSVVTSEIPPATVAAGNPAKVIMGLDEFLARRRDQIAAAPRFEARFGDPSGLSADEKRSMNAQMTDGIGYLP